MGRLRSAPVVLLRGGGHRNAWISTSPTADVRGDRRYRAPDPSLIR